MWTCPSCMAMPVSSRWDLPRAPRRRLPLAAWQRERRNSTGIRPIPGIFESRISASPVLRHRVDQGRLAPLDLRDGPLERRLEIVGALDGTFGPPAHRAGEAGEVGSRSKQI